MWMDVKNGISKIFSDSQSQVSGYPCSCFVSRPAAENRRIECSHKIAHFSKARIFFYVYPPFCSIFQYFFGLCYGSSVCSNSAIEFMVLILIIGIIILLVSLLSKLSNV
jgi:hypothetical protein